MGFAVFFWIGKRYYKLAELYSRKPAYYAFLGMLIYAFSSFILAMIFYVVYPDFVNRMEVDKPKVFDYFCYSVGLIFWNYGFLYFKRKFRRNREVLSDDIILIGKGLEE